MRILIVGFGYAGRRYHRAFAYLGKEGGIDIELAYVARRRRTDDLPYFDNVSAALNEFRPDIVVVSVNDHSHVAILRDLAGFSGFVICEKPLGVPGEDWGDVERGLCGVKGFALDLVERYSDATRQLREHVAQQRWSLARATFHWGKNRINDYRPTCGVVSEVIHALDLLSWICPEEGPLKLEAVSGIRSDFSISGPEVLDTVLLTGRLGMAPVAGYSSFVNIERQRTVDFTFVDEAAVIFHARIVFDTPEWDSDHLRIWTRNVCGKDVVVAELGTGERKDGLATVEKLSQLCEDVLLFASDAKMPRQPFADFSVATQLQSLLDEIERQALVPPPARYCRGNNRNLLPETADLESLG